MPVRSRCTRINRTLLFAWLLEAVEEQVQTEPGSGDNRFNPSISLVLQGGYIHYSEDPKHFHLEGMPLGGEAGLHEEEWPSGRRN
jgi:hypothetical protein